MSCIRDSSKEHKGSGHTHVSCDAILAIIADFYKNDEDVNDQFMNGMYMTWKGWRKLIHP